MENHMTEQITRRILIIDDDSDFLTGIRMQLRNSFVVLTAPSINAGMALLKNEDVDLVLLDVGLGEENGLNGIKQIREIHPSVGIAMLSGVSDVQTVVSAIRAGAIDYLTKPPSQAAIITVVEKAIMIRKAQERCEELSRSPARLQRSNQLKIVCKSKLMKKMLDEARLVKGHNANVLIEGETGTGKELLAQYIHQIEENERRPFVAVNCAAIPEQLLESELFGHEPGAFTGANRRRIGKFELADGGDIFLDEISSLKLDLQVKLLRVLQEKEFCRLGSNQPIKINFRVISASGQPLSEMVEKGSFRMDLYHRLRVLQIAIPPLRERVEDIPALAEHFLDCHVAGKARKHFTERAMVRLMEYTWPGNVRELANVIQSLVILTREDVIDENAFPSWVLNGGVPFRTPVNFDAQIFSENMQGKSMPLQDYVKNAEKNYITKILELNSGDKSKTAASLGIGRTTLYIKMRDMGLKF